MELILWVPVVGAGSIRAKWWGKFELSWWAGLPALAGALLTGVWLSVQIKHLFKDDDGPPAGFLRGERFTSSRNYLVRWQDRLTSEYIRTERENIKGYFPILADRILAVDKFSSAEVRRRFRTSYTNYVTADGVTEDATRIEQTEIMLTSLVSSWDITDRQVIILGLGCITFQGSEYNFEYIEFIERHFNPTFVDDN
ncbi:hypothetical protein [Flexivirga oryzae]|uniref:Uncharacterized protein n=1 Tax=Flexivirga oryzae TaxID=1794944 RepID=A0A839NB05_9MICO|nr:hypothetical protein [Flexivirga oryzae]MBB2893164.1 hypothetical protein [Flexivirga oryzae]